MMENVIKYPVWAHDDKWAWSLDSLRSLKLASKKYLDSGQLNNLRIIDSDLAYFEIADIKILGKAGIFGWRPGYSGIYFNVEFSLKEISRLSFNQAQDYVVEYASSHQNIYVAAESFADFKERVYRAADMVSLIEELN